MPAAVPVGAAALGVSTVVATAVVVGVAVVGTVIAAKAIGSALAGALSPDIPDYDDAQGSASDQIQGVKLTKSGTSENIPVIYGFRRVGGKILFAETSGSSNKYLYVVYAISEGEIEGVKRVFVDDTQLPITDPSIGTEHNITSGKFSDRLKIQIFSGTEAQSQSTLANETTSWSSKERKLPGLAYAVFRYEWKKIDTQEDADNNPYGGGLPSVMFDVLGKKTFDVTGHGSGTLGAYSGLSKTYTNNPANHLLDYLLNPRFGCGLDVTEVDADLFKTAANKLRQNIDYDENGTQDGPFMTGAFVLNSKSRLMDNVKVLVQGCRGYLPYSRGRYKLRIDDGGNDTDVTSSTVNVVADIGESDMLYGMNLIGEQKSAKFNNVIVKYVDPDQNFTEQQVNFSESADVTADGEDLTNEITYQGVSNRNIAQNIARTIYKNSRSQKYIGFTTTPETLEAEVGDIIRVTSSVFGLTDETFKIQKMIINPDGTVGVEARQHTASIYPFVPGAQIEIPPPVFKPDNFSLTPLQKTTNTTVPIQVRQPGQTQLVNSSHSNVTPTVPVTQNNTLPIPLFQTGGGVVSSFTSAFTAAGFGTTTSSAVTGQSGTLHTDPCNFRLIKISNTQFDCSFFVNPPADPTVDTLFIKHFERGTRKLRNTISTQLNNNANQPNEVYIRNIDAQSFLTFQFRGTAFSGTADDGSQVGTVFSFISLGNQPGRSGQSLEAAINSTIQAQSFATQQQNKTTKHSIGTP